MIVVGGLSFVTFPPIPLNDVWVLQNANGIGTPSWIQLTPAGTSPAGRHAFASAYDTASNQLTIFGGCTDSSFSCIVSDAQLWSLTNADGTTGTPQWTQLTYEGAALIAHAQFASSAYDPDRHLLFLFGGRIGPGGTFGTFTDITWALSNVNGSSGLPFWTMVTPNKSPSARGQSFTPNLYDRRTGRFIVFGGPGVNDTWTLNTGN